MLYYWLQLQSYYPANTCSFLETVVYIESKVAGTSSVIDHYWTHNRFKEEDITIINFCFIFTWMNKLQGYGTFFQQRFLTQIKLLIYSMWHWGLFKYILWSSSCTGLYNIKQKLPNHRPTMVGLTSWVVLFWSDDPGDPCKTRTKL